MMLVALREIAKSGCLVINQACREQFARETRHNDQGFIKHEKGLQWKWIPEKAIGAGRWAKLDD
ncbi:MAG: hypothetical protein NZM42_07440 [Gemmatales bacterium]|nr:hypothetical protein [Gemmatales bacterium]